MIKISIFFQNENVAIAFVIISILFIESKRKKINEFFEKNVFELVFIFEILARIRIFNSRFVNKMKNIERITIFEKFKLMSQIFNDHDKISIFTQKFTIQKMSQHFIFLLTAIIPNLDFWFKNISQTYIQSTTFLNRRFYIRSFPKLNIAKDSILKIINLFYKMPKAKTHWFNIYHNHHIKKLIMIESIYDFCLLHANNKKIEFEMIGFQTDDILILKNETFVTIKILRTSSTKAVVEDLDLIYRMSKNGLKSNAMQRIIT